MWMAGTSDISRFGDPIPFAMRKVVQGITYFSSHDFGIPSSPQAES